MKVESNKTNDQIPKDKQQKVLLKSENSSNLNFGNYINSNNNQPKKDFASILKGSDEKNELRSDNKNIEKSNDKNSVEDKEKESKTETKDQKEVREQKRDKSDSESDSDSEQNKQFGNVHTQNQQYLDTINIPSGRAIMHVTDLERIISKIRSQNVANGKQVTIDLKRSVFEGLQLKLTIGKDKSVIAEFIAANETIKSQLNARADELASLLRNRGIKLTKIHMSLSSDSNKHEGQDQSQTNEISSINRSSTLDSNDSEEFIAVNDSDTSYQI